MNAARVGGTWSNWNALLYEMRRLQRQGPQPRNRTSTNKFNKYLASTDRKEREDLATTDTREISQKGHYFVPVFRHAFVSAIGLRLAQKKKWQAVFLELLDQWVRLSVGGY